jgi:hypothetical protein
LVLLTFAVLSTTSNKNLSKNRILNCISYKE